jgi:hypothetical protein
MIGYGLDGWDSNPGRSTALHSVQTGSKARLVSYPVGIGEDFPMDKTVGA